MREIKFRVWDGEKMTSQIDLRVAHGLRLVSTSDLGFGMIGDDKCVLMQYTGLKDKNGKEIYEGDVVRVYDTNRYCVCSEWEDCDGSEEEGKGDYLDHKDHGDHKHEHHADCEQFICTQEVKWSYSSGYFCEEDTGDFCPPLGSDEMELEIIDNIYENPELLSTPLL